MGCGPSSSPAWHQESGSGGTGIAPQQIPSVVGPPSFLTAYRHWHRRHRQHRHHRHHHHHEPPQQQQRPRLCNDTISHLLRQEPLEGGGGGGKSPGTEPVQPKEGTDRVASNATEVARTVMTPTYTPKKKKKKKKTPPCARSRRRHLLKLFPATSFQLPAANRPRKFGGGGGVHGVLLWEWLQWQ
jgi:hypothetical protein